MLELRVDAGENAVIAETGGQVQTDYACCRRCDDSGGVTVAAGTGQGHERGQSGAGHRIGDGNSVFASALSGAFKGLGDYGRVVDVLCDSVTCG